MTAYLVEFTTAAAKEVRKLDPQVRRRVLAAIADLERDPRPPGVRKLAGHDDAWRVRIGDYRVLYEIADERVLVTRLPSRSPPSGIRRAMTPRNPSSKALDDRSWLPLHRGVRRG